MDWLANQNARARFTTLIALAVMVLFMALFAPSADGLGGVVIVFAALVLFCAVGCFLWQFVKGK